MWQLQPNTGDLDSSLDRFNKVERYLCYGPTDQGMVHTALWAESPAWLLGRPRTDVKVRQTGPSQWEGEVTYSAKLDGQGQYDANKIYYEFDTTGGSQHIVQSYQTVQSYVNPDFCEDSATAPSFNQAIGVSENGHIAGVSVPMPMYKFTLRKNFQPAQVTIGFCGAVAALTGKVNKAAFYGCQAGECMFMGGQGAQQKGVFPITFHFIAQPNKTDLSVGSISGIAKKGFEYLWCYYQTFEDPGPPKVIKQVPRYAYVEKVALEGDFSVLGLGSGT